MRLQFKNSWKSSGRLDPKNKGQKRYNYIVLGDKEELKAFKSRQDQFYRETEQGEPIFTSIKKLHKSKAHPLVIMTWGWKFTRV